MNGRKMMHGEGRSTMGKGDDTVVQSSGEGTGGQGTRDRG